SMIDPGTKGPVLQHPTEECGVVIKGTLTVWVGDEKFILKPGDSIRFPGNLPHRYENNGKIRCVSVWCMTPPGF
ncbi:MAG: cupin domain-containing protein, partial [Pseudorhodoplanes sp.]